MKRLLSFLVMLALIAYGSFKAAVWYFTDHHIARAAGHFEEIGVIDHGSIRSGVEGSVTLVDGRYEDFRLSQPITFGRLSLEAGSPLALMIALIDPAAFPEAWSLRGQGVSMSFDEALFRNWVTAAEEEQDPALFAPVCGPDARQQLGSGDLRKLGVTGVVGEVLIRQEPGQLYAEATTVETGSFELRWPGARLKPSDPAAVLESTAGPLQLNIRDGGLMRRLSAYCARESGMSVEEWTGVVLDAFGQALSVYGYEPSKQLRALYRQWLTEGGELTVTLNPSQPLWGIPLLAEGEAVNVDEKTTNAWVLYNEAKVPGVFLSQVTPEPEEVPAEAIEPVAPEAEPKTAGWMVRDKTAAASLIGQTIRVTLENGNIVEGRLSSVDEQRMEVVRLVDGGEVAYPIVIRLIETFEVWRRGQNFQPSTPES